MPFPILFKLVLSFNSLWTQCPVIAHQRHCSCSPQICAPARGRASARQWEQANNKVLETPIRLQISKKTNKKKTPNPIKTPHCVTTVTISAQLESVIPQRTISSSKLLSILAGSPHPEGATVPKQLKSMFESDTYYHPRLDLWPKVLLRWATALTEYPQSWTCLNIRHVDSLRQGEILFFSSDTTHTR